MLSVTYDTYILDKVCPLCFDNARVIVLSAPKNYAISELTGNAKFMGLIKRIVYLAHFSFILTI
jgi:hypothetical protein